jgi:hypothetical protein
MGAKLLMMQDEEEAQRIAVELDRLNGERQAIEVQTVAEAEAEALAAGLDDTGACVVTAGEGWHPGVVGLVAARLKEKFRKPAFAIAMTGKFGTGSARSIPGVDLGRIVRAAVEDGLLVKGGGHAMAAGLTIEKDKLIGELKDEKEDHNNTKKVFEKYKDSAERNINELNVLNNELDSKYTQLNNKVETYISDNSTLKKNYNKVLEELNNLKLSLPKPIEVIEDSNIIELGKKSKNKKTVSKEWIDAD